MPLSQFEARLRDHALLCSIGFLVVLPLGALVARYARNVTNKWWWIHLIFQLFLAGPLIFTGAYYGRDMARKLGNGEFNDPHKKIGLALLVLYVVQLVVGLFIHLVTMPSLFGGHRPPQNYFHAILGLSILALAAYQVHYGYTYEWVEATGARVPIPQSAKNAWLALVVVFWSLYAIGLVFLPRQYQRESLARRDESQKGKEDQPDGA